MDFNAIGLNCIEGFQDELFENEKYFMFLGKISTAKRFFFLGGGKLAFVRLARKLMSTATEMCCHVVFLAFNADFPNHEPLFVPQPKSPNATNAFLALRRTIFFAIKLPVALFDNS